MAKECQIADDIKWMHLAIVEARKGQGDTAPNPPVGAVIVKDSKLISTGYHKKAGLPHAEIEAISAAADLQQLKGATIYVTLEPCSTKGRTGPCTEAIKDAGISRVVFAVCDPNPEHAGRAVSVLQSAGIEVDTGILENEAAVLIAPFSKVMLKGLPYITLKMAMTMDGKIADRDGCSRWISGKSAGSIVQKLRHKCDAILVGANTVVKDDSQLICHDEPEKFRKRIIIASATKKMPLDLNVFSKYQDRTILIVSEDLRSDWIEDYKNSGVNVLEVPVDVEKGTLSLRCALEQLSKDGVTHILCEGGGQIAGELIAADLVDEFMFFVAPKFFGDGAVPVLSGQNWFLDESPEIEIKSTEMVGKDVLIKAIRKCEDGKIGKCQ
jgi:diaminohydroxyphosphoribosylaminopyrimidine deaminase / 5-amino-6-(5-phosphoribosylamino)uracil reductase